MTFTIAERDGEWLLQIEGQLDAVTVGDLRHACERLVHDPKDLTIDLSRLRHLDSAGMGLFVSLWKRLRAKGFNIRIVGATDHPLAIFKLLRLDRFMLSPPPLPRNRKVADPVSRLRLVSDVSERWMHAKSRGTGAALLIGAGCSATSNVPLASQVANIVLEKYPKSARRTMQHDYASLMQVLEIGERHDLIEELVAGARLNLTYRAIAALVKEGFVDRILTTNFDGLIMKACAEAGVKLYDYDLADVTKYDPGLVRSPALFYLHGRDGGFLQFHTEPEMRRHARSLVPVIDNAVSSRPTLVVGYSGLDPVFDVLADRKQYSYGLFWAHYGDELPEARLLKRLFESNEGTYFVLAGGGSDDFFTQLVGYLNVPVPTAGLLDFPDRRSTRSSG